MDLLQLFKNKTIYWVSDSDLDGIGSIIVGKYYLDSVCKKITIYSTAERDLPDFDFEEANKSDYILFTDIAPKSLDFHNQINSKNNIFIFDHHASSRQELGELDNYYFTDLKCGAKIFFDSLTENIRVKKTIYQFVELVDIYDRFVTSSNLWKNAKALSNIMYGYVDWKLAKYHTDLEKHTQFINKQLEKFDKGNSFYFTQLETVLATKAEQKEQTNFKKALDNLQFFEDESQNKYATFKVVSKLSIVSHLLLQHLGDKVNYLIGYTTYDPTNTKVSIRSNGSFNCTTISDIWKPKGIQCGGHPQAVGFECKTKQEAEDIINGKMKLI